MFTVLIEGVFGFVLGVLAVDVGHVRTLCTVLAWSLFFPLFVMTLRKALTLHLYELSQTKNPGREPDSN